MLKISKWSLALLLCLLFAAALISIRPANAYAGTNLYITPTQIVSKEYNIGDNITITIYGENFTDVYLVACSLQWNPAVLNLTAHYDAGLPGWVPHIYKGSFLEGTGISTGFLIGTINYAVGYAEDITYSRMGLVSGKTGAGPGTIATAEFTVVGYGDTKIDLYACDLFDSFGSSLPYPKNSQYDSMVKLSEWLHHDVTWDIYNFVVDTESNSSVTDFGFSQPNKLIYFNVTRATGTKGFCNVTIPKQLLDAPAPDNWIILIDGGSVTFTKTENATHTFLYFTYTHSTKMVYVKGTVVIPEFPSAIMLLAMLTATLIILVATRKIPKLKIKQR